MQGLANIKLKMSKSVCPKVNSIKVNGVELADKTESVVLVVGKGMPKAILTIYADALDIDGYFETIEQDAGRSKEVRNKGKRDGSLE